MKNTILMFVVAVMLCGCEFSEGGSGVMKWEVSSTSNDYDVCYRYDETSIPHLLYGLSGDWSYEMYLDAASGNLSVYNQDSSGTVVASIYIDGEEMVSKSCSGICNVHIRAYYSMD